MIDDINTATGKGVVPGSLYYTGASYNENSKEYDSSTYVDSLAASQGAFLRFAVEKGTQYTLTILGTDFASNTDIDLYYYDETGAHEITANYTEITLADNTDGYIYVSVTNTGVSAVTGGFEITKNA